jgi:geranylgeranyl diphosphate synthase type 3
MELKKHCVTLLEEFGSLSYTRHILEKLDAEVRTEVAKHGGNPLLEDVLDGLMSWKEDTNTKQSEQ